MLNSPSGSGKSALFQFAEQYIPTKTENKIAVIALSFNDWTGGDRENHYQPEEGLVLRVAERYFCGADCFRQFSKLWMSKLELRNLPLYDLLTLIIAPFQKAKFERLLILVDESRRSGHTAEFLAVEEELDRSKLTTDEIVTRLEAIQQQAVYNATRECRHNEPTSSYVTFVFSSLKPFFDAMELKHTAASDSGITWIDLPPAGGFDRSELRQRVMDSLPRIAHAHREKAVDFLIVMASGHWVSLLQLIFRVNQVPNPIITFDIVRQAAFSNDRYVTNTRSKLPLVFELIKMSLFNERKHPFESLKLRGVKEREGIDDRPHLRHPQFEQPAWGRRRVHTNNPQAFLA